MSWTARPSAGMIAPCAAVSRCMQASMGATRNVVGSNPLHAQLRDSQRQQVVQGFGVIETDGLSSFRLAQTVLRIFRTCDGCLQCFSSHPSVKLFNARQRTFSMYTISPGTKPLAYISTKLLSRSTRALRAPSGCFKNLPKIARVHVVPRACC